jgi:hypothetical protein
MRRRRLSVVVLFKRFKNFKRFRRRARNQNTAHSQAFIFSKGSARCYISRPKTTEPSSAEWNKDEQC